jgi:hypothetical protein
MNGLENPAEDEGLPQHENRGQLHPNRIAKDHGGKTDKNDTR